ncbi:MAG: hypothetical protein JWM82_1346 [Myxococcales bacterium]|nr:hypothetical protein [Myxococcales bacterium]
MRGALLFLCSVGLAVGGACSARSLLTIELSADGLSYGQKAEGNPQVDIVRDGTTDLVKQVDKSGGEPNGPFWLLVDDAKSLSIGVYLPGDVDGPVRVTARLVDGACRWSGMAPDRVEVHAGETASTSILMKRDQSCVLATIRDGGTVDGGDAGDGGTSSDTPPMLGADGGDGPPHTLAMKCATYCRAYADACLTPGDPESFTCMGRCLSAMWLDGQSTSAPEDTFACRWDHLRVVTNDASLSCSECFAASPESPGICAPAAPDGGARDACPPSD